MRKVFRLHWLYFTIYVVFAAIAAYFLIQYNKQEIHSYLNALHQPVNDLFFKYITHIGDGFTIVIITILALFWSKKYALQIGLSGVISGLIAQILKKVVFGPTPRPSKYFGELDIPLYYIDGVELNTVFSFPSGHTTAIFSLTTSILLLLNKKQGDLALIILALLTAYSRVYLSQHFLSDILLGSFIGVSTALIIYKLLFNSELLQSEKFNHPLIKLKK